MFEAKFLSTLEKVPYIGQGIWGVEGFEPCPTIGYNGAFRWRI